MAIVLALVAVVVWLAVKVLRPLFWHAKVSYQLRDIPYPQPPHWLWGHLAAVAEPSTDEARWDRWTADGKRLARFRMFYKAELYVVHPETAAVVLKTAGPKSEMEYGQLRAWLGNGLLISSGKKWSRDRRLLTRGFHFDILRGYLPIYREAASIMLEQWADASHGDMQTVNVTRSTKLLTLDIILRCIMSYESDCQNPKAEGKVVEYVNAVQEISQCIVTRYLRPWEYSDLVFSLTSNGRKFARLKQISDSTSEDIIRERRRAMANGGSQSPSLEENNVMERGKWRKNLDFLDILLTVRDEDGQRLTDKDIQEQVDTFLFEGHDTTATALQWTLYYLSRHLDIQEKCRQEVQRTMGERTELSYDDLANLNYLAQCIKESQRLCSTVTYISRTLTQPLIIDGHEIPAGITVTIPIIAIHRHPDVWERPQEFDPNRFSPENSANRNPFAFIPFSAGPRNCIGQSLALEELKTVISMALLRFRLTADMDVPKPKINSLLVSRPSEDLMVYAHEL